MDQCCEKQEYNTIKCGRVTYVLEDGDTVMDNGACLQLVTRKSKSGWWGSAPRVSKQEFNRFKKNSKVAISVLKHSDPCVTLWTYSVE